MLNKIKRSNIFIYAILFIGIFTLYVISRAVGINESDTKIQICMGVLIAVMLGYIVYAYRKKILTENDLVKYIIFIGIIMRVGYMLYTGCNTRSHDMHEFNIDGGGHAGYILNIIQEGHLPQSNFWQYYQQPFFYLTGSAVSRIANLILGCNDSYYLVDAAKIVSCFAVCMCVILTDKLSNIVGLKKNGRIIAVSVVAFTPAFYLAGGRTNCDALAVFFMLMEILYTIYFYRKPSWKNIICLAFIYGCGVMTKISCGSIAVFTAAVFLKMIYENRQNKAYLPLLLKYVTFAFISLPIGLWYGIRNLVRFKQPLTYVLELSKDLDIYCGDYSLIQRFFSIDIGNLFTTPFADPWSNYNLPVYLVKSSLFGEFAYVINDIIPVILLLTTLILTGLMVYSTIKMLSSYKINKTGASLAGIYWILIIMTVFFNVKYPFGCSMDYRYVIIISILGAILLGKISDDSKSRLFISFSKIATMVYATFSILFYLLI